MVCPEYEYCLAWNYGLNEELGELVAHIGCIAQDDYKWMAFPGFLSADLRLSYEHSEAA